MIWWIAGGFVALAVVVALVVIVGAGLEWLAELSAAEERGEGEWL